MNRRCFMKTPFLAGGLAALELETAAQGGQESGIPAYEHPLFNLHSVDPDPVRIASIELLRNGGNYFVKAVSEQGVTGIIKTKQVVHFVPILLDLVIPYFLGKDARDLEKLIDGVYIRNYKLAGQAFWCPVAYVEQSLLDLLGRIAGKPVGELLGGVVRHSIPVYLSGSGRETTAEEEVFVYERGVRETGARAVKFKIGGRMSRNRDAYPGRTEKLVELARKKLGDEMILYADANGSYDSVKGVEVGRMLESLAYAFFEEPCPWEELGETRKVTQALRMPVAAGEQDASLWRFQWMMENRVMDIVQPDLNYNGGLIRAARVARMARKHGMPITPHNTQTGPSAPNILQFASCVPNIGAFMEYPYRRRAEPESWYSPNFEIRDGQIDVPKGPGMGLEIDPDYLEKCKTIEFKS